MKVVKEKMKRGLEMGMIFWFWVLVRVYDERF